MPALAAAPTCAEPSDTLRAELARLRAGVDVLARVAGRPDLDDVFDADHAVRAGEALSEGLARHFAHLERAVAPRVLHAFPDTGALVDALVHEHRAIDACLDQLTPHLRALAAGQRVPVVPFAMAVGFVLDAVRPLFAREEGTLLALVDALPEGERRALAAALEG